MWPRSHQLDSTAAAVGFSLGAVLVVLGAVDIAADLVPWSPVSGVGLEYGIDVELLGLTAVTGAVLGNHVGSDPTFTTPPSDVDGPDVARSDVDDPGAARSDVDDPGAARSDVDGPDAARPVYITRPLLRSLLDSAQSAEPGALSIGLTVTPAGRMRGVDDLDDATPVFTHRYLPARPNSVSSVFGVDLQTPAAQTHGRFVTHPFSRLQLTKRDDLQEVVFVAVPPWDADSVAAFDRRGRRVGLTVVDAVPPEEDLPSPNR